MSPKEIISQFYALDFVKDKTVMSFFHDDFEMEWNSSKGILHYSKKDMEILFKELKRNYHSYQSDTHQILVENNSVTVRFTIYVTSIERPDKEDVLAHFMSISELKDSKIFKCYQISQLADNN